VGWAVGVSGCLWVDRVDIVGCSAHCRHMCVLWLPLCVSVRDYTFSPCLWSVVCVFPVGVVAQLAVPCASAVAVTGGYDAGVSSCYHSYRTPFVPRSCALCTLFCAYVSVVV